MSLSNFIKGWLGEKVVAAGLWLGLSKATYRRFHDVVIRAPDGTTQIDHVIVSPYGIFVIETKNMQGWIFGNAYHDNWTQTIYRHKSQFQNPLRQNYRHTQCLAEFLELDHGLFHPVIMFIGDCKLKTGVPANVMTHGLIPYIRGILTPILSAEQVQDAAQRLLALKSGKRISRAEHLRSLEVRHSTSLCPKCGSELVKRTAQRSAPQWRTLLRAARSGSVAPGYQMAAQGVRRPGQTLEDQERRSSHRLTSRLHEPKPQIQEKKNQSNRHKLMKRDSHSESALTTNDPSGMDLRDWFAALALSEIIATRPHETPEKRALESYQIADSMMRQRERTASGL